MLMIGCICILSACSDTPAYELYEKHFVEVVYPKWSKDFTVEEFKAIIKGQHKHQHAVWVAASQGKPTRQQVYYAKKKARRAAAALNAGNGAL
jgi:hypothetical protein